MNKFEMDRDLADDAAVARYVASLNLERRHLSTSQRAMIGAKLKPLFEEEAKRRQGQRSDIKANLPECSQARDEAASLRPRRVQVDLLEAYRRHEKTLKAHRAAAARA